MSRKIKLVSLIFIGSCFQCIAQEKNIFFQPEYSIGKIIPNGQIDTFPTVKAQQIFALNIGGVRLDTNSWGKYYNFPETGVTFLYSNLGNNEVFGHQLSILPFASFKIFNNYKLRIAAGVAYFSTFFDSINNPTNEVIGSHFTWDVKAMISRKIVSSKNFNLQLGVGFSHESNGHTRLPNLGINTVLASISAQFYTRNNEEFEFPLRKKGANRSPTKHFINIQEGIGFHEQDPTEGPLTNRSKPVYSSSIAYGFIFNNHIKLRAGLVYRFYEQYHTHLKENNVIGLSENIKKSSSNVILVVGNEFLMSHIGIDIRLGVNLHKPFYRQFNPQTDIGTRLRKIFSSRIGLNLYLKNTNELPPHNLFIGAHIVANMAKADFTEFSLGYTYLLNGK